MAASNPANDLASLFQSASINRHPSPTHDINPSTAASVKRPVHIRQPSGTSSSEHPSHDQIPISILDPQPRTSTLPPLPDLRFEQSYLARIKHCNTNLQVAWVTFVDHVFLPLSQGIVWNLALFGWRSWNTGVKFQGRGVGARVRKWWWEVNVSVAFWTLPFFVTSSTIRPQHYRALG